MDNEELVPDIKKIPVIVQPYVFSLTKSAWRSYRVDLLLLANQPEPVRKLFSRMMVGIPLLRLLASEYCRITDPTTQMTFLARVYCSWLRGVTVVSYPENVPEIHTFCTALDDFKMFCNHYH